MGDIRHLLRYFPKLIEGTYIVTSSKSEIYNCIAWAVNDENNWWWPTIWDYWPDNAPRFHTIEAFISAYETLGFRVCEFGDVEHNTDKIVFYADAGGPQHAAKQLKDGRWASKLGEFEDIIHNNAEDLECDLYGKVAIYMKRPRE